MPGDHSPSQDRPGGLSEFQILLAWLKGWVPGPTSPSNRPPAPHPRPRVEHLKVLGPGGVPSWLQRFWLGHSAHQQGTKDRLGPSAQRVYWPHWTSTHRAAWNSSGRSPVFDACSSQATARIHGLHHSPRGVSVGEHPP